MNSYCKCGQENLDGVAVRHIGGGGWHTKESCEVERPVSPATTAMTCELCHKDCDSRIGITIRGPMVCKSCFQLHGKKSWPELLEAYASSQSEKLVGIGQEAADEIWTREIDDKEEVQIIIDNLVAERLAK